MILFYLCTAKVVGVEVNQSHTKTNDNRVKITYSLNSSDSFGFFFKTSFLASE